MTTKTARRTPTSQNGWPLLDYGSPLLYTWTVPARTGHVRVTLRNGSAGFLLVYFLLLWAEKIEPLAGRIVDDWGHARRKIRAADEESNHGSGTAADANATQHPLGVSGTLILAEKRRVLRWLDRRFKATLRHGAFYRGRVDEMHVEIDAPLPDCERRARVLMHTPRGRRILHANPGQRAVIKS